MLTKMKSTGFCESLMVNNLKSIANHMKGIRFNHLFQINTNIRSIGSEVDFFFPILDKSHNYNAPNGQLHADEICDWYTHFTIHLQFQLNTPQFRKYQISINCSVFFSIKTNASYPNH